MMRLARRWCSRWTTPPLAATRFLIVGSGVESAAATAKEEAAREDRFFMQAFEDLGVEEDLVAEEDLAVGDDLDGEDDLDWVDSEEEPDSDLEGDDEDDPLTKLAIAGPGKVYLARVSKTLVSKIPGSLSV